MNKIQVKLYALCFEIWLVSFDQPLGWYFECICLRCSLAIWV